jgi:inner membrane transporter RhtA
MSLEPAIAVAIGFVVLHQAPGLASALGVGFVVAAGLGAERTGSRQVPASRIETDRCPGDLLAA